MVGAANRRVPGHTDGGDHLRLVEAAGFGHDLAGRARRVRQGGMQARAVREGAAWRIASPQATSSTSARKAAVMASRLPWVIIAPLGRPVVPLV